MLEVKNLSVIYGSVKILDSLSFSVGDGEWLMIIGPNGAGKSTVVNAISQGAPYTGSIGIDGRDLAQMKPSILAKKLGVLAQNHSVSYSFTVSEVVRLGRYAHSKGLFSAPPAEDAPMVERALRLTGMDALASQSVLTLSGGELQRAFLAQLFAQDPELLILDEPTNHLDLVYQKQVFALIKDWIAETGRSVVSVVHDLSLARAYGTHAVLLDHGHAAAVGEIGGVMTAENLDRVYRMDVGGWMRGLLSQWGEGQ